MVLLFVLAFLAGERLAAETGEILRAVEVRAVDVPAGLDLGSLVEVELGRPPEAAAVRRTLDNFWATGWFHHVEWRLRPVDDGVEGVVVLELHPRARDVILEGELGLRERRLRRTLKQREGTIFDAESVRESERALRELLKSEGYLEARVSSETRRGPAPWQDLFFRIESGPRAELGEIAFDGDTGPYDAETLRSALASRTGERYRTERAREDARRLRKFLADRGHFEARVEAPRRTYDSEADRVGLQFPVEAGPVFALDVFGEKPGRLRRRGFLPFLGDRPFDEPLLAQSCARLRRHYQEKGHYRVQVDCTVEPSPDEGGSRRIRIAVVPGPEFTVGSVRFPGAERIPESRLRALTATGPGAWWAPGSGHLVGEELEEDLERLRSFYLLEGFSEVSVGPAETVEEGSVLRVTVPIVEGPRRRVVSVDVTGPSAVPRETLLARLPLRAGSGYHPLLLEDAVNLVRTLHEEEGYATAVVTPRLDWDVDGRLVELELAVDPGPRRVLDRLVLRGLRHTRPQLIERFAALDPGDVLSRRRLLQAERDLYRLGIFSEVEVDLAPSVTLSSRRDVRIQLREGRRRRLAYGVSYHSDDGIGGLFGLSLLNLRGLGERLQLDVRASVNDQRLRLIYDQPSLGPWRLPVTYTLFNRFERRESYEVEEAGVRVSLVRDLDRLRLGLVYDYRIVELSEEVLDITEVEREDSEIEISSLAPNLFLDRRDDPLDPTLGWSTALQLEYAFPLGTAETELVKFFWQQTQYVDLGNWGTLASSFRLGLIEPFRRPSRPDPIVPDTLPSSRVPISERFFAGGRTTHRAYQRDALGLLDESIIPAPDGRLLEAGGNGLLLLNVDYRFPISGPVEGVTFFDLGNVWADWEAMDLGDLRPGAGIGVRYGSPVGPIRLEIGWKLDPEPFEDTGPVFFLSFGNPF